MEKKKKMPYMSKKDQKLFSAYLNYFGNLTEKQRKVECKKILEEELKEYSSKKVK